MSDSAHATLVVEEFPPRPRILLVDGKEREPWYRGLGQLIDADWIIPDAADVDCDVADIDLAIVNDERALPWVSAAVCALKRRQVPTLHIADGVVEWRNTWENPLYSIGDQPALPMFQPVLCDKIACLGRAQARLIESWGNVGKCEVVGAPRLDQFGVRRQHQRDPERPAQILVATARTPGFTPQQVDRVVQALGDLRKFFESCEAGPLAVEPLWRVSGDIAERVGVPTVLTDTFNAELMAQLESVDAFICTPSTALLEGMLAGVPVAAIDYTNSPPYNAAAWSITAPTQIADVIASLTYPSPQRMLYQDAVLHDQLECRTPAGDRLRALMLEMATLGRQCRTQGTPLKLPRRILLDAFKGHHRPEDDGDLPTLPTDHSALRELDAAFLQAEVGHLRRELARAQIVHDEELHRTQEELHRTQEELRNVTSSLTWRLARPVHAVLDRFHAVGRTAHSRCEPVLAKALTKHDYLRSPTVSDRSVGKSSAGVVDSLISAEVEYQPQGLNTENDLGIAQARLSLVSGSTEVHKALPHRRYGQLVAGPVFAAYSAWVVLECKARGIRRIDCLMREGEFLARIFQLAGSLLDAPLEVRTLHASRFCLRAATLTTPTASVFRAFLETVRPADVQSDLLAYLGLFDDALTAEWNDAGIASSPAVNRIDYAVQVFRKDAKAAQRVSDLAMSRKRGLMTYLTQQEFASGQDVVLADLGWGGTIQAALLPFLGELGLPCRVRAFYLGTDERIRRLNIQNCPWHSFLYEAGRPIEDAQLVKRTPELLEQFCMPPHGSLLEFTGTGEPLLAKNRINGQQIAEVAILQQGILDFTKQWLPRVVASCRTAAIGDDLKRLGDILRAIVSRSIDAPFDEEVALFADWTHDSNNGSEDCRNILGDQRAIELVRSGKILHPNEIDWLLSYWPQGLFRHLGVNWSRDSRRRFLSRLPRSVSSAIRHTERLARRAFELWGDGRCFLAETGRRLRHFLTRSGQP